MPKHAESKAVQVADELHRAAQAITDVLESVFEIICSVGDEFVRIHRDVMAQHELFAPEHLLRLRPLILEQLHQRPFVDGIGILTAPDLLVDRTRCVEWWRQDGNDIVPLWLNFDPTSVDIYDYLEMEWFTRAQRDNARTVFGPYVDYSGAGHYILTMTCPVVDNVFLGIVGADVRMSLFESEILDILNGLEHEVVLVNAERRVVAANSERWIVGTRLASMPSLVGGSFVAVARVEADSDWTLALLEREGVTS